jgi:hypothetical protein
MHQEWADIVVTAAREALNRLAQVAPRLLAVVTLVLLGWFAAALARYLTGRLLRAMDFDRRCARWGLAGILGRRGIRRPPSEVVRRLVFWTLFLIALLMGLEALEMPGTAGAVAVVIGFLPNVVVAILVMGGGWILARFLAQAALIAAVNAQLKGAPLAAGAVQWLVLVLAGAVSLTQLGIAREMVLLAFGIAFGGTVLALALAFGLGARDLARQALERYLGSEEEREPDQASHL